MKTIWKFPLLVIDRQIIDMPKGAEILTVQAQFDTICLWALVDPDADKEQRCFRVLGTGHNIYDPEKYLGKYIGTFQMHGGNLVFHVFEGSTP